jgi:hypothetical protein
MDIDQLMGTEAELPLERLVTDGGFCGILRTIGCVGDSLSSGEFEAKNEKGEKTYHDFYDYSWGQFLARMAGCTAYNFSRGGMSAKEYCDSFAEDMGFWAPEKACQAYIIALGVNDLLNMHMPVGDADTDVSLEDPASNELTTFAGYYGLLVSRLKAISPRAKFFFMTMPRSDTETPEGLARKEGHRKVLYRLAERFGNAYVLDFFQYAPVYDRQFRENFYLGGHMNPCGYLLTAKMVASYIDYIIRHNMADFKDAAFICTDLHA